MAPRRRWGVKGAVPFERLRTYPSTGAPAADNCSVTAVTVAGSAPSVRTRRVPSACAPNSGVALDHITGGTSMTMRSACSDTTSSASATRMPARSAVSAGCSPAGSIGKLEPSSSVHMRVASARVAVPCATSERPGEVPDERNLPMPWADESASTSITLRPALQAAIARFNPTLDAPMPGLGELTRSTRPVVWPSISRRMPVNRSVVSFSVSAGAGAASLGGIDPRQGMSASATASDGERRILIKENHAVAPAMAAMSAPTSTPMFVSHAMRTA